MIIFKKLLKSYASVCRWIVENNQIMEKDISGDIKNKPLSLIPLNQSTEQKTYWVSWPMWKRTDAKR
jgi:hypothetical protein